MRQMSNRKLSKPNAALRTSSAVYKFLLFKLQEQNTFWSYITDAPHFRYGGNFVFDAAMQEKAQTVREAIKEFEVALEKRQRKGA